ncbi:MAG: DUF1016 family protein [Chromatiaceae bacterium]|nr:DUF1016 family protein [Chromatiaceae bacterium]
MSNAIASLADYQDWLNTLKHRVQSARLRMALATNRELIQFYWELGTQIAEKQAQSQWGDKLIPQLSADLQKAFPDLKGLSASNLKYCLRFYQFYAGAAVVPFGQQPVDQIPWGHNILIFTKCSSDYDQPTIALLLCRDKNNIEVEFALRDMNNPMGVSEYTLVETLPDNLKGALPTVVEIEQNPQLPRDHDARESEL